jgi:hypothetical protein
MKKNNTILIIFILIATLSSTYGQEPAYKSYNWEPKPRIHQLNDTDSQLPELVMKELHLLEYTTINDEQVCYYLIHKIIRVNSDEAIKRNNRLYLPLSDNAKLIVNKARVINSNGQVKELKESDIKEGIDEDSKSTYRYFALDGIDKGSEIEYLNVIEQAPEYFGKLYILQNEIDKRNVEFEIIQPKHLVFKTKTYNGLPDLKDTVIANGLSALYVKMDKIPGVKEEPFATYKPHLMQVIFKLDENKSRNKKNIVNYVDASQNIYDFMHEPLEKSTTKSLQKIIRQMNLDTIQDPVEKIRAIENYVKTHYFITENSSNKSIPSILEYKVTGETGMTKLFSAILDQLQIEYELVVTSNRFKLKFDPKFEAYPFLDSYLIYFPGIKKYLCPGSSMHRLDCIPFIYFNNYGLFIRAVSLGDMKGGVGQIKFIEPGSYDKTNHDHYIKVDFSKSIDNPEISYTVLFSGLYAQSFQPYYSYLTEEKQTEMNNSILKSILKDATFTDIEVENKGSEYVGDKPLIIKAKCTNSNLIEQAGEKYLFKIGELIGPQTELYQKNERKFDIENDFNRSYKREITFEIPDGYRVTNLDALKLNVALLENNVPSSAFESNYEVQGRKVTVKVHEYYKSIFYPISKFEEYRKVINAAADFNKIVLILEKT